MTAVEAATAALRRGDLLSAYDLAGSALAAGETAERLRFLQVLALARMGDTAPALALYDRHGLDASADADCLALRGRLLKDAALAARPGDRLPLYAAASAAYADAHAATGQAFPAINAASLALLAGDAETARSLATRVLATPAIADPTGYFDTATRAEAKLLTGDVAGAGADIATAATLPDADAGARSSTLRQFALVAAHLGVPADALLAPLRPAPVLVFTGHMFRGGDGGEATAAAAIAAALDSHRITIGYGALACGADILFAEAVLARGGELAVVLPFAAEDFERQSVLPGGEGWLSRYRRCLDAATSVDFASTAGFVGDDGQYRYGGEVAMGLARWRARHLGADAIQIALWNGEAAMGDAGTAIDVAAWRRHGGTTHVLPLPEMDRALDRPDGATLPAVERGFRAMIFCDFVGFSKLSEIALPVFWDRVLGGIGRVFARHPGAVESANSWGDAVFAVIPDIAAAARIAIAIQAEIAGLDKAALGLPASAGMRIGLHYGPVFLADDPITGRANAFGTEVTRTARIEPIVPTGDVYVTQQYAAMLALAGDTAFTTYYVGQVKLAKGYGAFKMLRLVG